jgi:murein DD-endopeptidase MepM/ murein hydrolase activator NlpD
MLNIKNKAILKFLTIFLFFLSLTAVAQPPAEKKDFFNIKAPAIDNVEPSDEIMFEDEFSDSSESQGNTVNFDPRRALDMVDEDTSSVDDGELSVVEVSEQLKIDSIWVTIAEYYAIWDSRSVNPYKIDGAQFKDTLRIALYDTLAGFNWSMPLVRTPITSDFGMRHSRWHYGTDLKLQIGDPVMACFDGIVRIARYDRNGYGNYVMVRHYNGVETLYGHLSEVNVEVGQLVKAGQIIGLGGNTGRSTGPHLHFEVRYEGNAIDPEEMYNFIEYKLKDRFFVLDPSKFEYLRVARQVFYHKVRPGDNLGIISRKYKVSITTICRLNGITTRTPLKVGRRLRIR